MNRKINPFEAFFILWIVSLLGAPIVGCASIAQVFEKEISSSLEPITVHFKDQRCEIYREYSAPEIGTLKRMEAHELVTFDLEDGSSVNCKVSEEILDHADGSQNHWIWPISSNDKRCTGLLEGAAELD